MNKDIEIIQLRHELKSLIDGSILNIRRFDEILDKIESITRASQYQYSKERAKELIERI